MYDGDKILSNTFQVLITQFLGVVTNQFALFPTAELCVITSEPGRKPPGGNVRKKHLAVPH